jgi:hypothetical protein
MGYLKLIDPAARWTWTHPADPDVRFIYRALSGPVLDRDLGRRYLDACIEEAFNVDIPGVGPVAHWTRETGPAVEWSKVLPSDVANALFLEVGRVSILTPEEERDSSSPSGQPSTPTRSNAADAHAGNTGSVHDGRTTGKRTLRRAGGGTRSGTHD